MTMNAQGVDSRTLALVRSLAPHVYFDTAETIPLAHIGYTVLPGGGPSPSFRRELRLQGAEALVVEYAYFWDYDIQHLYDLEHIWVFADANGTPLRAQASFHGKFLDASALGTWEGTHIRAYCQPGKHAFLPDGQLFKLLPDHLSACTEDAGGGVLINDLSRGTFETTPVLDARVREYIRAHYAFTPTLCFEERLIDDALYMPWPQLRARIPERMRAQLAQITAPPVLSQP